MDQLARRGIVVPVPALASAPVAACLNCGTARLGAYCHECGQHFREERLALRLLAAEFAERVLSLEGGLLLTLRELTLRPGRMIAAYVGGQRRRYMNPFSYLFLSAAFSLLTYQTVYAEKTHAFRDAQARALPTDDSRLFNAAQAQAYMENIGMLSEQMAAGMLFMVVPLAGLLRLLFRRSGRNLAETGVFALFTLSHAMLFSTLWMALASLTLPITAALSLTGFIAPLAMVCGSAPRFFGGRVGAVLKAGVALTATYTVYFVTIALVAMFLALRSG